MHSGDATLVCPPRQINQETLGKIKQVCFLVADALNISGPFNMQLIAKVSFILGFVYKEPFVWVEVGVP